MPDGVGTDMPLLLLNDGANLVKAMDQGGYSLSL